jgi:hypothetical protein
MCSNVQIALIMEIMIIYHYSNDVTFSRIIIIKAVWSSFWHAQFTICLWSIMEIYTSSIIVPMNSSWKYQLLLELHQADNKSVIICWILCLLMHCRSTWKPGPNLSEAVWVCKVAHPLDHSKDRSYCLCLSAALHNTSYFTTVYLWVYIWLLTNMAFAIKYELRAFHKLQFMCCTVVIVS